MQRETPLEERRSNFPQRATPVRAAIPFESLVAIAIGSACSLTRAFDFFRQPVDGAFSPNRDPRVAVTFQLI
ncbi:hypothetical protein BWQ93_14865 [Sphingopyxis sp. QXT-31]|nr:hypothetical protein BWQ93_14865 [Sphingopyxis sp. QXT-31]